MKNITICLTAILLFSFAGTLISQETVKGMDQVYGPDQTLYNGKKYNYFLPIGTKGNQYLISPLFTPGSLTLKETCFTGIDLNYDIFNQQLLLKYRDDKGAMNIIEVSKAWIKTFRLGDMNFEYINLEKKPRYFQVLGEKPLRVLYYWRKTFDLEGSAGSYYFTFSKAIRDTYVLMNEQLKPFSTNQGFIRLFHPSHRPEIKNYMRKNKVRVKKASDQTMSELINFIGNLK